MSEQAKQAETQAGWISVADRLPTEATGFSIDPLEWVMCSNGPAVFLEMYQYYKDDGFVPYGSFKVDDRVTHWRPLPAPPSNNHQIKQTSVND